MKHFEINYPNGRSIFIKKLPRSRLGPLEAMLYSLQCRWLEYQRFTEVLIADKNAWEIIQNIAALFPRYDRPGEWGFDVEALRDDILKIEELFLFQTDEEGEAIACQLIAMHQFEPVPRPAAQEEEWLNTAVDPSGDPDMDLLANLAVGFSVNEALQLYNILDAEELDKFLYFAGELRRDPEEREMENLAEDYNAWKEENQTTFRESLGIKFQRPQE